MRTPVHSVPPTTKRFAFAEVNTVDRRSTRQSPEKMDKMTSEELQSGALYLKDSVDASCSRHHIEMLEMQIAEKDRELRNIRDDEDQFSKSMDRVIGELQTDIKSSKDRSRQMQALFDSQVARMMSYIGKLEADLEEARGTRSLASSSNGMRPALVIQQLKHLAEDADGRQQAEKLLHFKNRIEDQCRAYSVAQTQFLIAARRKVVLSRAFLCWQNQRNYICVLRQVRLARNKDDRLKRFFLALLTAVSTERKRRNRAHRLWLNCLKESLTRLIRLWAKISSTMGTIRSQFWERRNQRSLQRSLSAWWQLWGARAAMRRAAHVVSLRECRRKERWLLTKWHWITSRNKVLDGKVENALTKRKRCLERDALFMWTQAREEGCGENTGQCCSVCAMSQSSAWQLHKEGLTSAVFALVTRRQRHWAIRASFHSWIEMHLVAQRHRSAEVEILRRQLWGLASGTFCRWRQFSLASRHRALSEDTTRGCRALGLQRNAFEKWRVESGALSVAKSPRSEAVERCVDLLACERVQAGVLCVLRIWRFEVKRRLDRAHLLSLGASRILRTAIRRCVWRWKGRAVEKQRRNAKMHAVSQMIRRMVVAVVFGTWSELLSNDNGASVALVTRLAGMRTKLFSFREWVGRAAMKKRLGAMARKVKTNRLRRLISAGFCRWVDLLDRMGIAKTVAKHRTNRDRTAAVKGCFCSWIAAISDMHRRRVLVARSVAKQAALSVRRHFEGWRDHLETEQRSERDGRKESSDSEQQEPSRQGPQLARIVPGELQVDNDNGASVALVTRQAGMRTKLSSFREWVGRAAMKKRLGAMARKVKTNRLRRLISAGFCRWVDLLDMMGIAKTEAKHRTNRDRTAAVKGCFCSWIAAISDMRRRRVLVARSVAKQAALSVRRHFEGWRDHLETEQRSERDGRKESSDSEQQEPSRQGPQLARIVPGELQVDVLRSWHSTVARSKWCELGVARSACRRSVMTMRRTMICWASQHVEERGLQHRVGVLRHGFAWRASESIVGEWHIYAECMRLQRIRVQRFEEEVSYARNQRRVYAYFRVWQVSVAQQQLLRARSAEPDQDITHAVLFDCVQEWVGWVARILKYRVIASKLTRRARRWRLKPALRIWTLALHVARILRNRMRIYDTTLTRASVAAWSTFHRYRCEVLRRVEHNWGRRWRKNQAVIFLSWSVHSVRMRGLRAKVSFRSGANNSLRQAWVAWKILSHSESRCLVDGAYLDRVASSVARARHRTTARAAWTRWLAFCAGCHQRKHSRSKIATRRARMMGARVRAAFEEWAGAAHVHWTLPSPRSALQRCAVRAGLVECVASGRVTLSTLRTCGSPSAALVLRCVLDQWAAVAQCSRATMAKSLKAKMRMDTRTKRAALHSLRVYTACRLHWRSRSRLVVTAKRRKLLQAGVGAFVVYRQSNLVKTTRRARLIEVVSKQQRSRILGVAWNCWDFACAERKQNQESQRRKKLSSVRLRTRAMATTQSACFAEWMRVCWWKRRAERAKGWKGKTAQRTKAAVWHAWVSLVFEERKIRATRSRSTMAACTNHFRMWKTSASTARGQRARCRRVCSHRSNRARTTIIVGWWRLVHVEVEAAAISFARFAASLRLFAADGEARKSIILQDRASAPKLSAAASSVVSSAFDVFFTTLGVRQRCGCFLLLWKQACMMRTSRHRTLNAGGLERHLRRSRARETFAAWKCVAADSLKWRVIHAKLTASQTRRVVCAHFVEWRAVGWAARRLQRLCVKVGAVRLRAYVHAWHEYVRVESTRREMGIAIELTAYPWEQLAWRVVVSRRAVDLKREVFWRWVSVLCLHSLHKGTGDLACGPICWSDMASFCTDTLRTVRTWASKGEERRLARIKEGVFVSWSMLARGQAQHRACAVAVGIVRLRAGARRRLCRVALRRWMAQICSRMVLECGGALLANGAVLRFTNLLGSTMTMLRVLRLWAIKGLARHWAHIRQGVFAAWRMLALGGEHRALEVRFIESRVASSVDRRLCEMVLWRWCSQVCARAIAAGKGQLDAGASGLQAAVVLCSSVETLRLLREWAVRGEVRRLAHVQHGVLLAWNLWARGRRQATQALAVGILKFKSRGRSRRCGSVLKRWMAWLCTRAMRAGRGGLEVARHRSVDAADLLCSPTETLRMVRSWAVAGERLRLAHVRQGVFVAWRLLTLGSEVRMRELRFKAARVGCAGRVVAAWRCFAEQRAERNLALATRIAGARRGAERRMRESTLERWMARVCWAALSKSGGELDARGEAGAMAIRHDGRQTHVLLCSPLSSLRRLRAWAVRGEARRRRHVRLGVLVGWSLWAREARRASSIVEALQLRASQSIARRCVERWATALEASQARHSLAMAASKEHSGVLQVRFALARAFARKAEARYAMRCLHAWWVAVSESARWRRTRAAQTKLGQDRLLKRGVRAWRSVARSHRAVARFKLALRGRAAMACVRSAFDGLGCWRDTRRRTAEKRRRADLRARMQTMVGAWRHFVAVASGQWQRHAWQRLCLVRATCWSKQVECSRGHRRQALLKRCVARWFRALVMLRLAEAAQQIQLCQTLSAGVEGCVSECAESLGAAVAGVRGCVDDMDSAQRGKNAALIDKCCSLLSEGTANTLNINTANTLNTAITLNTANTLNIASTNFKAEPSPSASTFALTADATAAEPEPTLKLNSSKLSNSSSATPGKRELFASASSSLAGSASASSVVRATPAVNRRARMGAAEEAAANLPHDPSPNNANPA